MARQQEPEAGAAAHPSEDDGPVIELTEIVEDGGDGAPGEGDLLAAGGGESDVIELTEVADGDALSMPGLKLSEEQIQSALERVIRQMYAEKIEKLLYDAVEQTVTREIARIKSILLDKAPGT